MRVRRTQVYLSDEEQKAFKAIADKFGQSQSEVIRKAVNGYIEQHKCRNRLELFRTGSIYLVGSHRSA